MEKKEVEEPVPPKKRYLRMTKSIRIWLSHEISSVLDEYNRYEAATKREKELDTNIYYYKKGLGEYMKERNSTIHIGPEYLILALWVVWWWLTIDIKPWSLHWQRKINSSVLPQWNVFWSYFMSALAPNEMVVSFISTVRWKNQTQQEWKESE